MASISTIKTLGELRRARAASPEAFPRRSVKNEVRDNLIAKLQSGEPLFPGIIGYDETVIPQLVNAILSRHNFILLGLRGQAKSRILRALVSLLDEHLPVVAGCEIHDDPLAPICAACRMRIAAEGDDTNIAWLPREARYVEKLATPDVTIADMLGDIDPIKAARSGLQLSDELTMHYGLLPRANRGIFGINELPDLAGKIQVGLFNILQEGDVQIKGYPIRLPLDVLMVFTANPEDYTARGKIITPLKDRIGSEIRTHYPSTRQHAMAITAQEAWLDRARDAKTIDVPVYVREVVEEIAFQARADRKIDRRSGVSQRLAITCLENVLSNAERRALTSDETPVVAARDRCLRGAAVDHRQVRDGVRRRAEGRRQRRARPHPRVGRQRVRRALRQRRPAPRHRVVRPRRLAAVGRHLVGERPARAGARRAGARRARRPPAARHEDVRAGAGVGHRFRARRAFTRRRRSAAATTAAITPPSSRSGARPRARPSGTSKKGFRCRAGRRSITTSYQLSVIRSQLSVVQLKTTDD